MSGAAELVRALESEMPVNLSAAVCACEIADRVSLLSGAAVPPLIGINGAQGSGKSTMARLVALALERFHGIAATFLSLDDFYLTGAERQQLAHAVHPLCATRGVPGTHDVALLSRTIAALRQKQRNTQVPIPVFDKLADDRLPREAWREHAGCTDAILLEGWCVGLRREDLPPWEGPINELEATQDPEGEWYRWSLDALAQGYESLWEEISLLVLIEVPGIGSVIDSRLRQEETLGANDDRPRMDRAAVTRFVQHYERYTRALWAAMPQRADMLFHRDQDYGYARSGQ